MKPIDSVHTPTVVNGIHYIAGHRPGMGRLRNTPLGSVLGDRIHSNQPDSARHPLSHPGLLAWRGRFVLNYGPASIARRQTEFTLTSGAQASLPFTCGHPGKICYFPAIRSSKLIHPPSTASSLREFRGHQRILRRSPHFSHSTHPLEDLTIEVEREHDLQRYLAVPTELFGGFPLSLRELHLHGVRAELPWRNMGNLTSFILSFTDKISTV